LADSRGYRVHTREEVYGRRVLQSEAMQNLYSINLDKQCANPNCRPSMATICRPYSARFLQRISFRMRTPICQYGVVSAEFTATVWCVTWSS